MVFGVLTTTIGAALLGGVAVAGLITLLATRELAAASSRKGMRRLSRGVAVAIVPFFIVFVFIVIMEVLDVVSG